MKQGNLELSVVVDAEGTCLLVRGGVDTAECLPFIVRLYATLYRAWNDGDVAAGVAARMYDCEARIV